MPADGDLAATTGALLSVCARVLRETNDFDAVKLALGAMLCAVNADVQPPPRAGNTSDASSVWTQLEQTLASGGRAELTRAFTRHHYGRWATTLLVVGVQNWRAALTTSQAHELFDSHFLHAPAHQALSAIAAALGPTTTEADGCVPSDRASVCRALLVSMVGSGCLRRLFDAQLGELEGGVIDKAQVSADENDAFVSLLICLPSRLSNATRSAPPPALAPSTYFAKLTEAMVTSIGAMAHGRAMVHGGGVDDWLSGGAHSIALAMGGLLLGRIARLGHLSGALPHLIHNEPSPTQGGVKSAIERRRELCGALFASLPPGAVEAALEAVLRHAAAGHARVELLCSFCAPLTQRRYPPTPSPWHGPSQPGKPPRMADHSMTDHSAPMLTCTWRPSDAPLPFTATPPGSCCGSGSSSAASYRSERSNHSWRCSRHLEAATPPLPTQPRMRPPTPPRKLRVPRARPHLQGATPSTNPRIRVASQTHTRVASHTHMHMHMASHWRMHVHRCGVLLEAMHAVAEAWSAAAHVTHAPAAQQRYLTAALVCGLRALPPSSAASLISLLLGGVQTHLGAPDEETRRLGMRVAETVPTHGLLPASIPVVPCPWPCRPQDAFLQSRRKPQIPSMAPP